MRGALGFAAMHAVLAAPGLALLYALGFVDRWTRAAVALGPAYLCGVAATLPVLILMVLIGLPVRLPHLAGVALALTAGLAAAGWLTRRGGRPAIEPPPFRSSAEEWAARVAVAALALFFLVGATAFRKLPTVGDDFGMWSYKAQAFFQFGGEIHTDLFSGAIPGPTGLDYPILQPLLESLFFRAMGGIHTQEIHVALWILYGCFVWTVGFLIRSRGAGTIATLAPVAVLAVLPLAAEWAAIGYADTTGACFVGAGALAVGLWLDTEDRRYAILGGILLAGAANTKNEALVAAIAVVVAAAGAIAVARLRAWRSWLLVAGTLVAAALPWAIWRSANDVRNADASPLSDALSPGFVFDRLDRLSLAFGRLTRELAKQDQWLWLVPVFLAAALVCVVSGTARRQAAFYLTTALLMLGALVWVYGTAARDTAGWLDLSGTRAVTGIVFVCGVGLVHLTAIVLPEVLRKERAP